MTALFSFLSLFFGVFQVRDIYDSGDYLVLVTTDRQSAFDRILASIPFKGQVFHSIELTFFLRDCLFSCFNWIKRRKRDV